MNLKNKKTIIITVSTTIILLIFLSIFLINKYGFPTGRYKIDEAGFSVCTMDIPSSSCGGYTVRVESQDGTKTNYTVPGYDSDEGRERYDKVSAKISQAKESNARVNLNVNGEGEIVSVE